ncbi:MAG: hypothetical protein BWX70_02585 [Verrucomicrobia bacterium ADurb.Bin070]|nr:MAG: hypothetical protein BWX70_02585 [Verrucomicrobia bacterium ADurb.Bin070]
MLGTGGETGSVSESVRLLPLYFSTALIACVTCGCVRSSMKGRSAGCDQSDCPSRARTSKWWMPSGILAMSGSMTSPFLAGSQVTAARSASGRLSKAAGPCTIA